MLEFKQDWAMLADLHQSGQHFLARKTAGPNASPNSASPGPDATGSTSAPAAGVHAATGHGSHGSILP
jgi:hypothetical protein